MTKKKRNIIICVGILCVLSLIYSINHPQDFENNTIDNVTVSTNETTDTTITVFDNESSEKTETEKSTFESIQETINAEELNGRGMSDFDRSEPQYENITGYVVVGYNEERELNQSSNFKNTPWIIPTYKKDKQLYVESGSVEHKTKVTVKSQDLKHEGHGAYSGYLLVEKNENNDLFYINVNNFITRPYWENNYDLEAITLDGYYIAEFNQVSDYYPVDRGNDKVELKDGELVLVIGKTGVFGRGGPDRKTNPLEAIAFKEWKKGYGGVSVFLNQQDLTIIY